MFEGLVASVLSRYLESFIHVEGLGRDLRISLLSGLLALTGLRMKSECLAFLGLPLVVRYGRVQRLAVSIPWTAMSRQSVVVTLEDIVIVVAPKYDVCWRSHPRCCCFFLVLT